MVMYNNLMIEIAIVNYYILKKKSQKIRSHK